MTPAVLFHTGTKWAMSKLTETTLSLPKAPNDAQPKEFFRVSHPSFLRLLTDILVRVQLSRCLWWAMLCQYPATQRKRSVRSSKMGSAMRRKIQIHLLRVAWS